jgi:sigma-E factor negative regulatory protein RseA
MSDYLKNQLSAFIDGELPQHEIELLFKRLDGNAELRAALARYTVIGECLRTRPAEGPSRSFAEKVRAAVQANGPLSGEAAARRPWNWFRPVAGLAVAATVATVALFGLQRMQEPVLEQGTQLAASGEPTQVVIGAPAGATQTSYTVPAPATSAPLVSATRLTNYVVAHSEYSSPLGRRNVLSGIVAEDPTPLAAPDQDPAPASSVPAEQSRAQQ